MELDEAIKLIDTLKKEKEDLQKQLLDISNEKESLSTLSETLKNDKEELSKQVTSLKESNMRYFERLTFQNETLKDENIETNKPKDEETTVSLDDVVKSLL